MIHYEKYHSQPAVIEFLPYSEQAEAAHRWQSLEQRTNNTYLTNSWIWIKTWLDYHADKVQPTFAFGQQDNQTIGAALVVKTTHKTRKGIPVPTIHLGTGMFVEYNRLQVIPQYMDAFATGLVLALQNKLRWSEFHLDGFVPEDAHALIRAGDNGSSPFQVEVCKSPTFDFQKAADEGYQDVIAALGKSTRYNIRRSLRLCENTFGQQQIEWAETPEQAKDMLQELMDLNQKRWNSVKKAGSFYQKHVRQYYEGLIDALKLWPQGSLIVCRVKHGETTMGCVFNYVENGHLMFDKSGIAQLEDGKMKPGLITHVACMQECWRRSLAEQKHGKPGLCKYDFLAGTTEYKDNLSNTAGSLIWATARRGFLLWLVEKAREVNNMRKQFALL